MAGPPTPVAPGLVKPTEYWKDTSLRLANGSLDEKGAKAKKKKANVPHNYVSDLQADLITLGYLKAKADDGDFGPGTERAIKRFQRHAAADRQGRGIGSALLAELERRVRAAGIRRGQLVVLRSNPEAVAFYARNGWQVRDDLLFLTKDV
jgi:ribosomal protein S18 acetylase RimI-like enzyme